MSRLILVAVLIASTSKSQLTLPTEYTTFQDATHTEITTSATEPTSPATNNKTTDQVHGSNGTDTETDFDLTTIFSNSGISTEMAGMFTSTSVGTSTGDNGDATTKPTVDPSSEDDKNTSFAPTSNSTDLTHYNSDNPTLSNTPNRHKVSLQTTKPTNPSSPDADYIYITEIITEIYEMTTVVAEVAGATDVTHENSLKNSPESTKVPSLPVDYKLWVVIAVSSLALTVIILFIMLIFYYFSKRKNSYNIGEQSSNEIALYHYGDKNIEPRSYSSYFDNTGYNNNEVDLKESTFTDIPLERLDDREDDGHGHNIGLNSKKEVIMV